MNNVDWLVSRGECCWFVFIYRRLRRMMIVKKKRELGLISYLNSKTVRYKQMQSSARLKSRYKGRFVANAYDWSVCNKII